MTTQDILELAARVEAAPADEQRELIWEAANAVRVAGDLMRQKFEAGAFLDAAMKLVPGNWTAWELRSRGAKTRFVAEVSRLDENGDDEEHRLGHAATPALALTAAALKARAHTKGEE